MARLYHIFGPVYDSESEILILGSFPSVKSREESFYYAHPQNRFWRVLAACFGGDIPVTTEEKRAFLLENKVALWDVVESCEVNGSSDASIRGAVPTDIARICREAPIRRIILNGRTAERYFRRFFAELPVYAIAVPSTSPANAACGIIELTDAWRAAIFS